MSTENRLAPPHLIGTPTYYQWRHDNFPSRNPNATPPDYYLNYGYKYAQKFQNETNQKLSPQGQKWTGEVMTNLQILLENRLSQSDGAEFEQNEQALKNFAFATHIEAYWNENGTTPLYLLTVTDLFRILFTPSFCDLVSGKGLLQIVMVIGRFVKKFCSYPAATQN